MCNLTKKGVPYRSKEHKKLKKNHSTFKYQKSPTKNYFTLNTSLMSRANKNRFSRHKRANQNKYIEMFGSKKKLDGANNRRARVKRMDISSQFDSSVNSSVNLRSNSRSGVLNLSLKPSHADPIAKLKLQTFNNFLAPEVQSTTFRGRKTETRRCSRTERASFAMNNFLRMNSTKQIDAPAEDTKKSTSSKLDAFFKKWVTKKKNVSKNMANSKVIGPHKINFDHEFMKRSHSSNEATHRSRTKS